jgi:hypothetical protein
MRFAGLLVLLACGLADADAQLASDAVPVQLATGGACTRLTHLMSLEPGVVERAMKQHALTPITLEAIVLPQGAQVIDSSYNALVTVKLGTRTVRGILVRLSGNGCVRPDHRHAIDRDGGIYQFDGPSGVVDYARNTCHTARGWETCPLKGQTDVLYVVPDRVTKYAGQFGSDGATLYAFQ